MHDLAQTIDSYRRMIGSPEEAVAILHSKALNARRVAEAWGCGEDELAFGRPVRNRDEVGKSDERSMKVRVSTPLLDDVMPVVPCSFCSPTAALSPLHHQSPIRHASLQRQRPARRMLRYAHRRKASASLCARRVAFAVVGSIIDNR